MKIRKSILQNIIVAFFLFTWIEPTGLSSSSIHIVIGLVRWGSFFFALFITLVRTKRHFNELKLSVILVISIIIVGVSTLLYSGELNSDYLFLFRSIFACVVLTSYFIQKNPRGTIYVYAIVFSTLIILDAITMVPNNSYGVTEYYLLGTKTSITYYLLPAIAFDYSALSISEKKIFPTILLGLTIISCFYYWYLQPISTTLVCIILQIAALFLVKQNGKIGRLICSYGFIGAVAINIVFINIGAFGFTKSIITEYLHESVDLNGRWQIWAMAMLNIRKHFILGCGYGTGIRLNVWESTNMGTHNVILQILLVGGIVSIIIIGYFFLLLHRKYRDLFDKPEVQYVFFTLSIMVLEGITEHFWYNTMTYCFMALYGSINVLCYQEAKK